MKIKLYKNYGVLGHEKEVIYTYFMPASEVHDRVIVDIPQVVGMNSYDEPMVSLDGSNYHLQDVLIAVNNMPALGWYDGQNYHVMILLAVEEVEHD